MTANITMKLPRHLRPLPTWFQGPASYVSTFDIDIDDLKEDNGGPGNEVGPLQE